MKQNKIGTKIMIAGGLLLSVMLYSSCNKTSQVTAPNPNTLALDAKGAPRNSPVAWFKFDSSWTEHVQKLKGKPYNHAKFSSAKQAKVGKAAFLSKDSGYVVYGDAGTLNTTFTTGLSVDFWMYATPKEGGAQCVFALPQTGAFWPDMHVLLDGYNSSQGDSMLIKVMFKANRPINYNEEWHTQGGIPRAYNKWTHVQYSYDGATSEFTLIVNNVTYFDHVLVYTDDPMMGGQPLGNIVANPNPDGFLVGTFQNVWDPNTFGPPQVWMLPFTGRIDDLKFYSSAIF